MPVDSKHPDWDDRKDEWVAMRDCARGETAIKRKTATYLPIPDGMRDGGSEGVLMYAAYLTRATFPEVITPTLAGMLGLIHRTEADIKMPSAMDPLRESVTKDGMTLPAFHREITRELLQMGRYAVLADAPSLPTIGPNGRKLPYLAGYSTESLINWSPAADLFVLDETAKELDPDKFDWDDKEKWRVLRFKDGTYTQQIYEAGNKDAGGEIVTPQAVGGKKLPAIPLAVASARRVEVSPDTPPLIGVARSGLVMYRLDADYKHQLFMSGQETLLFTTSAAAADMPKTVGAGCRWVLPAGSDAKYVGPQGVGIAAHRLALTDERDNCAAQGARLLDTSQKAGVEAADALRIRVTGQTATLLTVAVSAAALLEKSLRNIALFMNLNPDDVVVTPNLKFADTAMTPQDATALMDLWLGEAISYDTLYENLQRGEVASAERDAAEERALIDSEPPPKPTPPVLPGVPHASLVPPRLTGKAGDKAGTGSPAGDAAATGA